MAGQGKLMKAAVLYKAEDLRLEDRAFPEPADDEVIVQMSMNGICGSDIHFYERGELGPFKVTVPYVPGHEAAGRVVESARDGRGPAKGQRVAIEPGIPCRRCELCKSGRYNLCSDVRFLSAPPVDGTFSEYVAIPGDFAHALPESVDDESGAFIEPISVGLQACIRAGLKAADSVAILGSGPIGLVTYLVARSFGAAEIYMVDILKNRLEKAKALGATETIDSKDFDPVAVIEDLTSGRGVDVVFDTSGSSEACALAPKIASRGGSITLVGWPETSVFPYPVEVLIEKELDLHGVNRYCNTFPKAISLLAGGGLEIKSLITNHFPFERVCEAFEFARDNRSSTIKIMVASG